MERVGIQHDQVDQPLLVLSAVELQGNLGGRLDTGASRTLDIAACCGMFCAVFASIPTKATLLELVAGWSGLDYLVVCHRVTALSASKFHL